MHYVAKVPFTYRTRRLLADDVFELDHPNHARLMAAMNRARVATPEEVEAYERSKGQPAQAPAPAPAPVQPPAEQPLAIGLGFEPKRDFEPPAGWRADQPVEGKPVDPVGTAAFGLLPAAQDSVRNESTGGESGSSAATSGSPAPETGPEDAKSESTDGADTAAADGGKPAAKTGGRRRGG